MRDFAFVQTSPGRLFVGWGPFEQLPFRRPERPAFFITDFFLDEPHPWRHPQDWEEISVDDFAARFEGYDVPEIDWETPSFADFTRLFDSALEPMRAGTLTKIVPVLFESGRFAKPAPHWGYFLSRLAALPAGMFAYGYSYKGHGMIGATPELLFQAEAHGYRTMALAGTRPVQRAHELLADPKERREHRLVVDDIVRRLAPFGNVEIGPLGLLILPSIAHLITPIFFMEMGTERMTFGEMVRRLHPTAALGVSPRNSEGERWLREADRGVKRRSFGAPFGVERADHSALALVAIRNVQWSGEQVRVGSGAGLLVESHLEREFEELRQKREQVKSLFGIERQAWATSSSHSN
ncbi:MAG TPA: chorismate-binding protein [Thermoanaerobaculia bacterium]|jgi:menaquinone-specific isochorismate synthase